MGILRSQSHAAYISNKMYKALVCLVYLIMEIDVWHTIIEADPQYMRTFPSIFSTGNRASADSSSSIGIDGTYLWGFLAGIPKFHMSDDT